MLSSLPMLTVRVRLGVPCVGGALCPPGRGKTWAGAAALGHCPRCRGSGTQHLGLGAAYGSLLPFLVATGAPVFNWGQPPFGVLASGASLELGLAG